MFKIPLIYKAGLANIVPAQVVSHFVTFFERLLICCMLQVFNFDKCVSEVMTTRNWCEEMVITIEQILLKNNIVYFTPELEINAHFFGKLEVFTCTGETIELRDIILTLQCGRLTYNYQEFSQGLNLYFTFGPIQLR